MRINEFASAEEQLELWKLVNQSVISAIEAQRQQQAKVNKTKAARAKTKPGRFKRAATTKRSGIARSIPPPSPKASITSKAAVEPKNQPRGSAKTNTTTPEKLKKPIRPISAPNSMISAPAGTTPTTSITSAPVVPSTIPSSQSAAIKPSAIAATTPLSSQSSAAPTAPKTPLSINARQPRNSAMSGHVVPPQPAIPRQQITVPVKNPGSAG